MRTVLKRYTNAEVGEDGEHGSVSQRLVDDCGASEADDARKGWKDGSTRKKKEVEWRWKRHRSLVGTMAGGQCGRESNHLAPDDVTDDVRLVKLV